MSGWVDKAAAGLLATTAALPGLLSNDITTPVLGVGVTTVAGAVAGTFGAIGYDENARRGARLYVIALSTVIIAALLVGVIPRAFGWEWSSGAAEGALAGVTAVIFYYLGPRIIKRGQKLVDQFQLSDIMPWRRDTAMRKPPDVTPPTGEDTDR